MFLSPKNSQKCKQYIRLQGLRVWVWENIAFPPGPGQLAEADAKELLSVIRFIALSQVTGEVRTPMQPGWEGVGWGGAGQRGQWQGLNSMGWMETAQSGIPGNTMICLVKEKCFS